MGALHPGKLQVPVDQVRARAVAGNAEHAIAAEQGIHIGRGIQFVSILVVERDISRVIH